MLREHSHFLPGVAAAALSCLVLCQGEVAEGRSCSGSASGALAHWQSRLGKIQLCTQMLVEKVSLLCILSRNLTIPLSNPPYGRSTCLDLPFPREWATPHSPLLFSRQGKRHRGAAQPWSGQPDMPLLCIVSSHSQQSTAAVGFIRLRRPALEPM